MVTVKLEHVLKRLSIENIMSYLTLKGWALKKGYSHPNLYIFERMESNDAYLDSIVLPSSHTFKDFIARFIEIMEQLSTLENRDQDDILYDIINPQTDRFKMTISSNLTAENSIPLSYAKICIDAIKQLIIAAISNELENKPFYRRPKREAIQLVKSFNLGHTQPGSFAFVIEAPVLTETSNKMNNDIPFNRRVLLRIIRGINELPYPEGQQYNKGLNANMCEALMKFNYSSDIDTSIKCIIDWAVKFPPDSIVMNHATLYPITFRQLQRTSKMLRELKQVYPENDYRSVASYGKVSDSYSEIEIDRLEEVLNQQIRIIGRISRLESDAQSGYQLHIFPEEVYLNIVSVSVPVKLEDFMQGCLARGFPVSVTGILHKYGNIYAMTQISEFRVLD